MHATQCRLHIADRCSRLFFDARIAAAAAVAEHASLAIVGDLFGLERVSAEGRRVSVVACANGKRNRKSWHAAEKLRLWLVCAHRSISRKNLPLSALNIRVDRESLRTAPPRIPSRRL